MYDNYRLSAYGGMLRVNSVKAKLEWSYGTFILVDHEDSENIHETWAGKDSIEDIVAVSGLETKCDKYDFLGLQIYKSVDPDFGDVDSVQDIGANIVYDRYLTPPTVAKGSNFAEFVKLKNNHRHTKLDYRDYDEMALCSLVELVPLVESFEGFYKRGDELPEWLSDYEPLLSSGKSIEFKGTCVKITNYVDLKNVDCAKGDSEVFKLYSSIVFSSLSDLQYLIKASHSRLGNEDRRFVPDNGFCDQGGKQLILSPTVDCGFGNDTIDVSSFKPDVELKTWLQLCQEGSLYPVAGQPDSYRCCKGSQCTKGLSSNFWTIVGQDDGLYFTDGEYQTPIFRVQNKEGSETVVERLELDHSGMVSEVDRNKGIQRYSGTEAQKVYDDWMSSLWGRDIDPALGRYKQSRCYESPLEKYLYNNYFEKDLDCVELVKRMFPLFIHAQEVARLCKLTEEVDPIFVRHETDCELVNLEKFDVTVFDFEYFVDNPPGANSGVKFPKRSLIVSHRDYDQEISYGSRNQISDIGPGDPVNFREFFKARSKLVGSKVEPKITYILDWSPATRKSGELDCKPLPHPCDYDGNFDDLSKLCGRMQSKTDTKNKVYLDFEVFAVIDTEQMEAVVKYKRERQFTTTEDMFKWMVENLKEENSVSGTVKTDCGEYRFMLPRPWAFGTKAGDKGAIVVHPLSKVNTRSNQYSAKINSILKCDRGPWYVDHLGPNDKWEMISEGTDRLWASAPVRVTITRGTDVTTYTPNCYSATVFGEMYNHVAWFLKATYKDATSASRTRGTISAIVAFGGAMKAWYTHSPLTIIWTVWHTYVAVSHVAPNFIVRIEFEVMSVLDGVILLVSILMSVAGESKPDKVMTLLNAVVMVTYHYETGSDVMLTYQVMLAFSILSLLFEFTDVVIHGFVGAGGGRFMRWLHRNPRFGFPWLAPHEITPSWALLQYLTYRDHKRLETDPDSHKFQFWMKSIETSKTHKTPGYFNLSSQKIGIASAVQSVDAKDLKSNYVSIIDQVSALKKNVDRCQVTVYGSSQNLYCTWLARDKVAIVRHGCVKNKTGWFGRVNKNTEEDYTNGFKNITKSGGLPTIYLPDHDKTLSLNGVLTKDPHDLLWVFKVNGNDINKNFVPFKTGNFHGSTDLAWLVRSDALMPINVSGHNYFGDFQFGDCGGIIVVAVGGEIAVLGVHTMKFSELRVLNRMGIDLTTYQCSPFSDSCIGNFDTCDLSAIPGGVPFSHASYTIELVRAFPEEFTSDKLKSCGSGGSVDDFYIVPGSNESEYIVRAPVEDLEYRPILKAFGCDLDTAKLYMARAIFILRQEIARGTPSKFWSKEIYTKSVTSHYGFIVRRENKYLFQNQGVNVECQSLGDRGWFLCITFGISMYVVRILFYGLQSYSFEPSSIVIGLAYICMAVVMCAEFGTRSELWKLYGVCGIAHFFQCLIRIAGAGKIWQFLTLLQWSLGSLWSVFNFLHAWWETGSLLRGLSDRRFWGPLYKLSYAFSSAMLTNVISGPPKRFYQASVLSWATPVGSTPQGLVAGVITWAIGVSGRVELVMLPVLMETIGIALVYVSYKFSGDCALMGVKCPGVMKEEIKLPFYERLGLSFYKRIPGVAMSTDDTVDMPEKLFIAFGKQLYTNLQRLQNYIDESVMHSLQEKLNKPDVASTMEIVRVYAEWVPKIIGLKDNPSHDEYMLALTRTVPSLLQSDDGNLSDGTDSELAISKELLGKYIKSRFLAQCMPEGDPNKLSASSISQFLAQSRKLLELSAREYHEMHYYKLLELRDSGKLEKADFAKLAKAVKAHGSMVSSQFKQAWDGYSRGFKNEILGVVLDGIDPVLLNCQSDVKGNQYLSAARTFVIDFCKDIMTSSDYKQRMPKIPVDATLSVKIAMVLIYLATTSVAESSLQSDESTQDPTLKEKQKQLADALREIKKVEVEISGLDPRVDGNKLVRKTLNVKLNGLKEMASKFKKEVNVAISEQKQKHAESIKDQKAWLKTNAEYAATLRKKEEIKKDTIQILNSLRIALGFGNSNYSYPKIATTLRLLLDQNPTNKVFEFLKGTNVKVPGYNLNFKYGTGKVENITFDPKEGSVGVGALYHVDDEHLFETKFKDSKKERDVRAIVYLSENVNFPPATEVLSVIDSNGTQQTDLDKMCALISSSSAALTVSVIRPTSDYADVSPFVQGAKAGRYYNSCTMLMTNCGILAQDLPGSGDDFDKDFTNAKAQYQQVRRIENHQKDCDACKETVFHQNCRKESKCSSGFRGSTLSLISTNLHNHSLHCSLVAMQGCYDCELCDACGGKSRGCSEVDPCRSRGYHGRICPNKQCQDHKCTFDHVPANIIDTRTVSVDLKNKSVLCESQAYAGQPGIVKLSVEVEVDEDTVKLTNRDTNTKEDFLVNENVCPDGFEPVPDCFIPNGIGGAYCVSKAAKAKLGKYMGQVIYAALINLRRKHYQAVESCTQCVNLSACLHTKRMFDGKEQSITSIALQGGEISSILPALEKKITHKGNTFSSKHCVFKNDSLHDSRTCEVCKAGAIPEMAKHTVVRWLVLKGLQHLNGVCSASNCDAGQLYRNANQCWCCLKQRHVESSE